MSILNESVDDLIKKANNALEDDNADDAFDYAEKALEINPESSEAYLVYLKTTLYLYTDDHREVEAAIKWGEKAILYSDDKDKTTAEVYQTYIKLGQELFVKSSTYLAFEVEEIKKLAAYNKHRALEEDKAVRKQHLSVTTKFVFDLKEEIPKQYIETHEDIQDEIVTLTNYFIGMLKIDAGRMEIYDANYKKSSMPGLQEVLQLLMSGLSENKAREVHVDEFKAIFENGGCYIATCVYGSYDCPQVWTLRRFRDDTLDESWYGRIFIKCYYAVSPVLVKWFGETKWFRNFWKTKLDKMVACLKGRGVADTFYNDKY